MHFLRTILLFSFTISCAFAQNPSLTGRWEGFDKTEKIIFLLNPDGSGSFDGIPFSYLVEGKEIIATYDYGVFHYEYELKGSQLTIKEGNLEHPYTFTKTKDDALPKTTQTAPKSTDPNLLGTWTNPLHSVTFKEDGTLVVDGKKHVFEAKDGRMKIFTGNTMEENPYSVYQNILSFALNGEVVQLKKQDPIYRELAGKWCLVGTTNGAPSISGECIIFTAEGDYLYFKETKTVSDNAAMNINDRGTWSATAEKITFNSDSKTSESVLLAKKKHAVLGYLVVEINGRSFISADKKTAW